MEYIVLLFLLTTPSSVTLSINEFTGAMTYDYLHVPLQSKNQNHPTENIKVLRTFRKATDAPISGKLSATISQPRCGIDDSFSNTSLKYRVMGYWRKKKLTYRIYNYSRDLGLAKTRFAIQTAFRYWSEVSPLRFQEVHQGRADIKFSFHRKDKSCPIPFDGPGKVLAHADAPESGIVHFDDDEKWTEGKDSGFNLRIVAAHEIGHVLGLGHSQYYNSLMGPIYKGYRPNFKLHPDDIQGIQAIYGKPVKYPRASRNTSPVTPAARPPDLCKATVDAIMLGPFRKTYIFHRHYVWTVSSTGNSVPVPISVLWKGLPGNLNAAVHSQRTRKSYFLKGDKIWRYSGFKLDHGFPRLLTNIPSNVDSALYLNRNNKVIFLKGSVYWQWDENRAMDISLYPKPISQLFSGLPDNTEAAFAWTDGYMYFFKGDKFWRINEFHPTADEGYPHSTRQKWMLCDR
ncbi:matrix metalloproteinase-19-like [Osmerus mordax]|uniref:matrix metalloproteinase-19-like n=1 Tax=Osmerus mordax TaxID=8014 RepID=UPI00350F351B